MHYMCMLRRERVWKKLYNYKFHSLCFARYYYIFPTLPYIKKAYIFLFDFRNLKEIHILGNGKIEKKL